LGVEKISINTSLLNDFELIKRAAEAVGSQSIVAVLDIKKKIFWNRALKRSIKNKNF
jgi:cyclase